MKRWPLGVRRETVSKDNKEVRSPSNALGEELIIIIFMRSNSKKQVPKGPQCTICLERAANSSIDGCSHEFCLRCIKRWARTKNNCPLCRERFLSIKTKNRVIPVEPVPQRTRVPRPSVAPAQSQPGRLFYMPFVMYPQPSCFIYPSSQGIVFAPSFPHFPSIPYPLASPSYFVSNS